jgi:hypothetical protein
MEAIDGICMDTDGLKWFNWLYLQVTRAVEARVAANGFQDPEWLAALDVEFAGLYFGALKAALSGVGSVPDCWQVLLDRRGDFAVARIQFALAGINAHINHDLPEAIVATGCAPAHGSGHYTDYTAVNGTMDSLAREAAWNNADVLWGLRGAPALEARTLSTIDGMTAVIGKALLVPVR